VTDPQPFVKWVGGKRSLADRILAHRPPDMRNYVEPFVGGGAVFFALRRSGWDGLAILNDTNAELMMAYKAVRDNIRALVQLLRGYVNNETLYYQTRGADTRKMSDLERTARLIYLNKTAFNGLWRENRAGKMNAPFGHYEKPTICDEDRLYAASAALRNTTLVCKSFAELGALIGNRDFVYADPPYLPVSPTANFTGYGKVGFGRAEQQSLVDMARAWAAKGAKVVLSNADVPLARELYGYEFEREHVSAARAINSKGAKRGKVGELILRIGWICGYCGTLLVAGDCRKCNPRTTYCHIT